MYWWMRIDETGHPEPKTVPTISYQLEQLSDPAFVPDFSKCRFVFERDECVDEVIMDFATYLHPTFFVREKAFCILNKYIATFAKHSPFSCEGHIYYFIKIDVEFNLFDYEASTYSRWGMYERIEDEVNTVTRVMIKHPPPDTPDIFRLKGRNGVRKNIIVSDRFKQTYEENGLTGLYFKPAEPLPN
ncbi:MAG: hypothetical protein OEL76_16240 [Siculibacillus sp.]|nr:hypothetical protein [Siculibacillus sp.]